MPKKKEQKEVQKEFYIKGKQEIKDPTAPVISDEFIDKQKEGDYIGQTIEVHSETNLEQDLGTGAVHIMRTYEFKTDPQLLHQVKNQKAKFPPNQELFNSHSRGIAGMLWSDGFTPVTDLEPRVLFSKDKSKYLIMVWATPSLGQIVTDKINTLSEIAHGQNNSRKNTNKV